MCCKDHESLAYLRLKPRRMDKSQSQMFISKVIRSSDKETVKKKITGLLQLRDPAARNHESLGSMICI